MTTFRFRGALALAPVLAAGGCGFFAPEAAAPDASATIERPGRIAAGPRHDGANAGAVRGAIARHARSQGVPVSLADAVVRVESRYNPRAAHAGNYGLMQIRLQTAQSLGYSGGAAGLLDAETNLRFGMQYLAGAHKLAGGDVCRTMMKYQSGHRAIRLSAANRAYCGKVKAIMAGAG